MTSNNDSTVEIRRIRAGEWRALRALRLEALRNSPRSFGSTFAQEAERQDEQWQSQASRLAEGIDNVGVAAVVGEAWMAMARGYLDGAGEGQPIAHLIAVYVAPGWRRRGLAKAVSSEVVKWARSRGAKEVRLHVADWNTEARRAYESLGFVPTGELTALPHDSSVVEIEMRLLFDETR